MPVGLAPRGQHGKKYRTDNQAAHEDRQKHDRDCQHRGGYGACRQEASCGRKNHAEDDCGAAKKSSSVAPLGPCCCGGPKNQHFLPISPVVQHILCTRRSHHIGHSRILERRDPDANTPPLNAQPHHSIPAMRRPKWRICRLTTEHPIGSVGDCLSDAASESPSIGGHQGLSESFVHFCCFYHAQPGEG